MGGLVRLIGCLISCSLLLLLSPGIVLSAPAELVCRLTLVRPEKPGGAPGFQVNIDSLSGKQITLLLPSLLRGEFEPDKYRVRRNGRRLPLLGSVTRAAAAKHLAYFTFLKGPRFIFRRDLTRHYDLFLPGVYTVDFSLRFRDYYYGKRRKTRKPRDYRPIEIKCNTLRFRAPLETRRDYEWRLLLKKDPSLRRKAGRFRDFVADFRRRTKFSDTASVRLRHHVKKARKREFKIRLNGFARRGVGEFIMACARDARCSTVSDPLRFDFAGAELGELGNFMQRISTGPGAGSHYELISRGRRKYTVKFSGVIPGSTAISSGRATFLNGVIRALRRQNMNVVVREIGGKAGAQQATFDVYTENYSDFLAFPRSLRGRGSTFHVRSMRIRHSRHGRLYFAVSVHNGPGENRVAVLNAFTSPLERTLYAPMLKAHTDLRLYRVRFGEKKSSHGIRKIVSLSAEFASPTSFMKYLEEVVRVHPDVRLHKISVRRPWPSRPRLDVHVLFAHTVPRSLPNRRRRIAPFTGRCDIWKKMRPLFLFSAYYGGVKVRIKRIRFSIPTSDVGILSADFDLKSGDEKKIAQFLEEARSWREIVIGKPRRILNGKYRVNIRATANLTRACPKPKLGP